MTLTEAIDAYEKQFRDAFPYVQFNNEADALAAIKTALETGKPIETPPPPFYT